MQDRDNLAQEINTENEQITYYGRECQEKDREIERINGDNIKMADEIVRLSEVLKSVGEKYNLMEDELTNARNI